MRNTPGTQITEKRLKEILRKLEEFRLIYNQIKPANPYQKQEKIRRNCGTSIKYIERKILNDRQIKGAIDALISESKSRNLSDPKIRESVIRQEKNFALPYHLSDDVLKNLATVFEEKYSRSNQLLYEVKSCETLCAIFIKKSKEFLKEYSSIKDKDGQTNQSKYLTIMRLKSQIMQLLSALVVIISNTRPKAQQVKHISYGLGATYLEYRLI